MMSYKIKLNCLKFSLSATFLLFLQVASAQSHLTELQNTVEAQKKMLGNDLVVYVATKDTVVFQKTFGEANNRMQAPLGAASAWFTTALILQLADEGKLSLDDKINQYLPIYDSYFKSYVTIRHCLTHMTGIQADAFKTASMTGKRKYASLEEEVNDFAKKEIQANAGEEFRYNHMGLNIAARVAEIVTRKKFEQLTRQRIFAPLGMRNTSFTTDDGSAPNPAAGAKTTGADLTRFLQMLLNGGTLNGKKILSEEAIAELRKIQVPKNLMKFSPKALDGFSYTLGTWSADSQEEVGSASGTLMSPGFTGAWSLVNFEKGYSLVVLPRSFTGEQKTEMYLELKEIIDGFIGRFKK